MRIPLRGHEVLMVLVFAVHVLLVPPAKVEESFTLHFVRDALAKGVNAAGLQQYDHLEFSGAVPRSTIGPLALAGLSALPLRLASQLDLIRTGAEVQLIVRLTLAAVNALALALFSRRVRATYGAKVAKYFLLLASTQFHVPFWAGRTLPNMLAFPLVQVALALLITPPVLSSVSKPRFSTRTYILSAFSILTFAAVIMRLELVALIIPFALEHLARRLVGPVQLIATGLVSAVGSLGLSVLVDSYFWRRKTLLWPEGQAFLFNVLQGRSAEWGISPPLYYFTSALPKVLHLSLLPAVFSLLADRRTRRLLFPCFAYVGLLSSLKHKEWRFVVYVFPAFTVGAAAGIVAIGSLTASPRLRRGVLLAIVAVNLLLTALGLVASAANYPGYSAIAFLNNYLTEYASSDDTSGPLKQVHVGIEAKMTGASNFVLLDSAHATRPKGEKAWYLSPSSCTPPPIHFDRSEGPAYSTFDGLVSSGRFDYALLDVMASQEVSERGDVEVLYEATAFDGFDWRAAAAGRWRDVARKAVKVKVVKLR
ncbi:alpha-1,6-mannosyltransferase, glycosyltransferase family 22 protein [Rhodotorula toruloides]|uniref:Mannosyltransferase n=1 Tax=Rhodotorula toruloides TaxID=5286 RepID=A0A511KLH2_RHOTO|nr:alpha-1,6-mannosyltransferase, glycosyltransferase family 22 protein [Rhodotorula toruloides]